MNSVKCTILFIVVVASIYGTEQRKNNALQNLKTVSFKQSQEVPLDQNLHKDEQGPLKARKRRTRNVTRSRNVINDATIKQDLRNNFYNIGMRQDPNLQDCQNSEFKTTFPDIDYTLLGYNILDGFPMTAGHDPGFTNPIFKADYSTGRQTADCRYSVPNGLVVIPDVACVISFSSTTVKNSHDYDEALSVSASVSAGGWGLSFSASAGYKQEYSEIATGESVVILSAASCQYYFSKLISNRPPKFDDVFLQWLFRLNATDLDPDLYFMFFDTYGTHFPTEVTFGARFIYQFKMSSNTYEEKRSQGVDIDVQASYAGLFSAGGGFNMDSSQRQAASNFSKDVTTKTITVGAAPPANGDAMTWASEVKDSPVPTKFKLSSIEQLFSNMYMGHLNIDHERIGHSISESKYKYCLLKGGKIDECEPPGRIYIKNTQTHGWFQRHNESSMSQCIDLCKKNSQCVAFDYCTTCSKDYNYACFFYRSLDTITSEASTKQDWQTVVFTDKIESYFKYENTAVTAFPRKSGDYADPDDCKKLCLNNSYCVAFSFRDLQVGNFKIWCRFYSKDEITALRKEIGTSTVFIPRLSKTSL